MVLESLPVMDRGWRENKYFLNNGFKQIETKDRFELLVKQFNKGKKPSFHNWEENKIISKGFKMVYANQCQMLVKSANDLTKTANKNNISLKISEMKFPVDAQNAPSGYGVMNITSNGMVIADHYISKRRFENILMK